MKTIMVIYELTVRNYEAELKPKYYGTSINNIVVYITNFVESLIRNKS